VDGLLKGKKEIIPGVVNRMLVLLNSLLPAGVKEIIIRQRLATIIKS
jgi:hypothetical protein